VATVINYPLIVEVEESIYLIKSTT
jgi:hypothetical protein